MRKRLWQYQINPLTGSWFKLEGRKIPTSAEMLMRILNKKGPIEGPWYVPQNAREARVGDRIVVRINSSRPRPGDILGIVAVGRIHKIVSVQRIAWLT